MCHFQHDPRPMVASRIQTLDFTKCNYNFHELSVVSPLPVQHVKSLTKTPKTKRAKSNDICRNFQKGFSSASFLTAPTNMSFSMPMLQRLILLFRLRIQSHRPCHLRHGIPRTSRVSIASRSECLLESSLLPTPSRKQLFDRAHTDFGYEIDPWQTGSIGHASGSSRGNDHPRLLMF
jgi:hypothetical protein